LITIECEFCRWKWRNNETWWNMMKYDEIWWNMMKYDER
jgi:hypothetical protein